MIVSLIVAHGPHREIGLDNKLLWHNSDDLKNFKKITSNKSIVMGRKTFQSIGRALPNRLNIVLTRDENFNAEGVVVVHDPMTAFEAALDHNDNDDSELVVCGGEEIYKLFLPYVQKIYLSTMIDYKGSADAFFPVISEFGEWRVEENSIEKFSDFEFKILERV